MQPLDKQLPPPRTWETFEELTRALFAAVWEHPLAQQNGRKGQAQAGVDIYGEPRPGSWHGIQCKGKTRSYGAKATIAEFDAELKKAETFSPSLSHWALATTAPNDAALQEHARKVSLARVKAGKFPVDVLGWDTLVALLSQHPDVLRQFYPELITSLPTDLAKLEAASAAALAAIEDGLTHRDISVSLVRPTCWQAAREALSGSNIVRLTGEGGAGKSGLLKRLGITFNGPRLVLKDNRITATTLQQHLVQLGIAGSLEDLLNELAGADQALCLIDGADRLLMSNRRGVVTDIVAAIARSADRERWKIVTTARPFQDHDLVASALVETGFEHLGIAIHIGSIDEADGHALAAAFPTFAPLVKRSDLAGQNRSLFLLREMLRYDQAPARTFTEVDMASAWATAPASDPTASPRRGKALSELGRLLIETPGLRPARADFDPIGLQTLIEEGSVLVLPARDAVTLTYDVHEDWLLARSLERERARLPEILRAAGEPLWWRRAVRMVGQTLLEGGDLGGWDQALSALDSGAGLDPAWSRALIVSPLYSERAADVLPKLEERWLADDASLLKRLLDTLIVFETGIDEAMLASPALAHLSETERYTLAAYWKQPNFRSWTAFLSWSLPHWRSWPAMLIPRLADVAVIFTRATARIPNRFSQAIAGICAEWLREIEDARHCEDWDARRSPFDLDLLQDRWGEVEKRLREALAYTVDSAPDALEAYLKRLEGSRRLRDARAGLIESPQRIPSVVPRAWADMCLAHFVPHRRVHRLGPGALFGAQLFPFHSYESAGIRDASGFFPSSPLRGGFADLFDADERQALRLLHRLEMRASVFWRRYKKCEDRRRPIPTILDMPWGKITLWGDDAVYRWSRGVLGPHVLGSAYLALDQWMSGQAASGRSPAELVQLALQNHGLVASAAACIGMLSEQVNEKGAIDIAGPFLGEPRLWDFDIRRHIDEQGVAHRIGFWSSENVHYQAVERLHQRRAAQRPLSHALLLPFRLMGAAETQHSFDRRREQWQARDVAVYEDELEDELRQAELTARIERCRSDGDPGRIEFEQSDDADNQILVSIAPPEDAASDIAAAALERDRLERASRLANWVNRTRDRAQLDEALPIVEAISLAKALAEESKGRLGGGENFLFARIGGAAIVGTAAVAALYGSRELVESERSWIELWLLAGAHMRRGQSESGVTIDEAILTNDAQVLGAWGLAGLTSRFPTSPDMDRIVLSLAVQRLHAVTEATLEGVRWDERPDFARNLVVTALDSCIVDVGHWWWGDKEKRRAAARTERLRQRAIGRGSRSGAADRSPLFPPAPFEWRWLWSIRKFALPRRIKLKSRTMLDWSKAKVILKRVDWSRLSRGEESAEPLARYLGALVRWTRGYSEEQAERYDSQFPYEWGHELARAIGRFAATHGRSDDWESLRSFTYHHRAEELVGDYLDGVAHHLIESGHAPDARFWSAWKPAAKWVMQTSVPRRRDRHDHLSQPLRTAGFVGPYFTPIPPDWPFLEDLLDWIDDWVSATSHLPSAAYAVLAIVERMTPDQRLRWFLPWLERFVDRHGPDESFWSYDGLGNKAAALAKPLSDAGAEPRLRARTCLAIIADAGSPVARDLLPRFAAPRPGA